VLVTFAVISASTLLFVYSLTGTAATSDLKLMANASSLNEKQSGQCCSNIIPGVPVVCNACSENNCNFFLCGGCDCKCCDRVGFPGNRGWDWHKLELAMVDHDPADGKEKPTMRCTRTGGAGIHGSRCDSVQFQNGYEMEGNILTTSHATQQRHAAQYMSILNKDGTESICSAGKGACTDVPEYIQFFQVADTNFFHLSEHYHYLTVRGLRIGHGFATSDLFSGYSWWLSGPECTEIPDGEGSFDLRCPTDQNAYVIFHPNGEGFTVTSEPDCDAVLGVRAYWRHVTDAGPTGGSYTFKHGTEELTSVSNKATYTNEVVSKIEADIGRFVGIPKVISGGTTQTITDEVVQIVQTDLKI